jgi:hypothetical protein
MLNIFTVITIFIVAQEIYRVIFNNYSIAGAIVNSLFGVLGFSITRLVLNHDIQKFERWKKQATEFTLEAQGIVTDLSLSSTRENGRNTVILSATHNDHELTFSGINPDYQFKYATGDSIELLVHPSDSQQFVLKDLK